MRIFLYGLFVLILVHFFLAPAFSCPQNVQKVKSGTTTNCDGWLVSEPKMQEFSKQHDELELRRKLQLQQEHLRKLDLEEIEYYKLKNKHTQSALEKSESQKFWSNIGMFSLGVVLTGVAAKAAIEATRR
jgi:hypothetical protein